LIEHLPKGGAMGYEGLAAVIADYIDQRKRQKLEPVEKEIEKLKNESDAGTGVSLELLEHTSKLKDIEEDHVYSTWLTDAAKRAKQISLATHAIKFTHADARGSSVLALENSVECSDYLSTAALNSPDIDAVGNAAALDVAKLLQLKYGDSSLAACLRCNDNSVLASFSKNQEQLDEWASGFKMALSDDSLKSHTLAKQLFLPIGDNEYHLLSPLFSSSLSQQLYLRVQATRYSDEAKCVRDAKKAKTYTDKLDTRYPDTAVQNFGGSKPQNISQLNSGRGGKSYLFSCAPPFWQSAIKPPLKSKSIFSGEYNRRARKQAQKFQQYLLSIQKRDSNVDIRKKVKTYLDELLDTLFNYAAEVQSLTGFAGWSAEAADLKKEERLWLDPYRKDPLFQEERAKGDWQARVAESFAFWLKGRLKDEKMIFGEVEHQEWRRLAERRLREFEDGLPEVLT